MITKQYQHTHALLAAAVVVSPRARLPKQPQKHALPSSPSNRTLDGRIPYEPGTQTRLVFGNRRRRHKFKHRAAKHGVALAISHVTAAVHIVYPYRRYPENTSRSRRQTARPIASANQKFTKTENEPAGILMERLTARSFQTFVINRTSHRIAPST